MAVFFKTVVTLINRKILYVQPFSYRFSTDKKRGLKAFASFSCKPWIAQKYRTKNYTVNINLRRLPELTGRLNLSTITNYWFFLPPDPFFPLPFECMGIIFEQ